MTNQRSNSKKQHRAPKARPQAPPKREKPQPSTPNISPEEAARRAGLSPKHKSEEATQAGIADKEKAEAEHEANWWKEEYRRPALDDEYHDFFKIPKPSDSGDGTGSSSGSGASFLFSHARPPPKTPTWKEQRRAEKAAAAEEARERAKERRKEARDAKERSWADFMNTFSAPTTPDQDVEFYGTYYQSLVSDLAAFRSNSSAPFPTIKKLICTKNKCTKNEILGICQCGFEKVMRGSGKYSKEWLRKERLGWHPDKFSGGGKRMENAREKASEIFKLFQRLLQD